MIRLKINLNKEQIKEWCRRNGYSVITAGEIVKKRFGLKSTKEIISKINFPGNPERFTDIELKRELNEQLIYKDGDEKELIENMIYNIFNCLFYLGDSKIPKTKVKNIYKTYPGGGVHYGAVQIEEYKLDLCILTYHIHCMKIIDEEIVLDYHGVYSNIKSPEDFYAERVVEREITEFVYGK